MNRFGKFAICAFIIPAGSLAAGIAAAAPGSDEQRDSMTQQSQSGSTSYGTTGDTASGRSTMDRTTAGHRSMGKSGGSQSAEYMESAPNESVRVESILGKPLHVRSGDDEIGTTGMDDPSDDVADATSNEGFGSSDSSERGKEVGEISDLIIDQSGQVVAAVVDIGGFLGMGQHPVAISWDSIERGMNEDRDGYEFTVNATEKDLREAPAFDEESDDARVRSTSTD